MNELALFAGAGGGILGGHLLGWRTVCAVEIDPFCREVLLRRQVDGCLPRFPIWDDIRTFDGKPWRGLVDVVSGGFPCQDISAAGRGAGITGERSGLWSEMARVVSEVRPRYVFVENSPLLVRRGLAVVLGDLASLGYDARWCVLGADDAGAPHRRKRIWIVADAKGSGIHGKHGNNTQEEGAQSFFLHSESDCLCEGMADADHQGESGLSEHDGPRHRLPESAGCPVPDAYRPRLAQHPCERADARQEQSSPVRVRWWDADPADMADAELHRVEVGRGVEIVGQCCESGRIRRPFAQSIETEKGKIQPAPDDERSVHDQRPGWCWGLESRLDRVAHGVANRVDRLRAIGNGQVPCVAALAWEILTTTTPHAAAGGEE